MKGLLIGKFMPPHLGHKYLVDFAANYVDELSVLVCTLKSYPIPGELRYEWMRRSFGGARVIHHTSVIPEYPQEARSEEEFYVLWRDSILQHAGRPDIVFASEPYGTPLAEALGAKFVPVDPAREVFPVSGTGCRDRLSDFWDYLLPAAKPYFATRVALVGPESSGKSTLSKKLAAHYHTKYVPEYGRTYTECLPDSSIDFAAMETIVRGHLASEDAIAQGCSGLLICDTEAIVSKLWAQVYAGGVPPLIDQLVQNERYRLYLVTQETETWVDDGSRIHSDFADRRRFRDNCVRELESLGRNYVVLSGTLEERFWQAAEAIDLLLAQESSWRLPCSAG